jgi:hypothetical protein
LRGVTLERYDDLLAMLGFEAADPARRASCSAG